MISFICVHKGVDEGVIDLVRHDEPLGRNAGFAVVVEPPHDREFHRRFDVGILKHEVGVVRSQLEHGLLQRLGRHGADMAAGPIAAGQGHAAHQRMLDQLVAGVVVDQDDLEQVLGQARLDAQLAQAQAGAGADAGVFQHAGIARHQVRGQHADRLIKREVPRLDRIDHADRLIADHAALALGAMGALLVGQRVRAGLGRVVEDRGADLDLGLAVFQQLAGLVRHQRGQIVGIVAQLLRDLGQVGRAVARGTGAPFQKRGMTGLQAGRRCLFGHQGVGLDALRWRD